MTVYCFSDKFSAYIIRKTEGFIKEDVDHGLKIIFNFLFIVILSSVFCVFSGRWFDVVITMVSIILLRLFTGGHHFKSSDVCVVFSSLVLNISPYISDYIHRFEKIELDLITLVLIVLLSPFQQSFNIRDRRKIISILIVTANMVLMSSPIISTALLIQAIDLITLKRKISYDR
ncbi:accessory gene regulator B family protein [Paenibacillus medicaginis]|uniref:Accessory gene regulator B family protein n=1 Tax=Paenibacillus medicaginis TaxID=1470560 RepID=A0ABV5BVI8_9BACL